MASINADNLTPGVIDGYAKHAFKYGACGALAIALHRHTGWPIVAITDHHNVYENHQAGGGSALHWAVQTPGGKLLDIDGLHDPEELTEEYHGDADDGIAAWGISSEADAHEWYVLNQGEPIPISVAGSYITPLLETYGQPAASNQAQQRMKMKP